MVRNKILQVDPSETVEVEVFRHPVGLIPIIFTGGLIFFIFAILSALFINGNITDGTESFGIAVPAVAGAIFCLILSILTLVLTGIAAHIYRSNELVITNENLIQVIQTSLFSRKVSQLSLEKVQDVTVTQRGIAQSVLNYGTIFVETAGETANFGFSYAPDPNIAAKEINEAHERFIKKFGIDVV